MMQMMKPITLVTLCASVALFGALAGCAPSGERVKTENGTVQGTRTSSGIRVFRGVPFAAPPVGDLRWKEPQPVQNWSGVRQTVDFGPMCMQRAIFGDMEFRAKSMGEDCLYLNVWTPANAEVGKLPVFVYFFGGGLMAGDGSEPRYDGESMAQRGIVSVTINYRLNVFGFLAHPELTAESSHKASGNYGFLDQTAALKWVQRNIAAFGGDPKRVTIAGESAGSRSVTMQLLSPLSKGLFAGAVMESGSVVSAQNPTTLADAEKEGLQFMAVAKAANLKELRAMPAKQILEVTADRSAPRFAPVAENYMLPQKDLAAYVDAGEQAHVPVLQGTNSQERAYETFLGDNPATPQGYAAAVKKMFGANANRVLALYPAKTSDEIKDAAMTLGSDQFMAYGVWRLAEGHRKSNSGPVFRYFYTRPRPKFLGAANQTPGTAGGIVTNAAPNAVPVTWRGAVHSAEIEYALGTLGTNKHYAWDANDQKVSKTLQAQFEYFIKKGDPNGDGVPRWPAYSADDGFQIMVVDVDSHAVPENRARFLLLDEILRKK
jgi:para-nitrobenzyl esterase